MKEPDSNPNAESNLPKTEEPVSARQESTAPAPTAGKTSVRKPPPWRKAEVAGRDTTCPVSFPRTYSRSGWQNFVRWVAFVGICLIDLLVTASAIHHNFFHGTHSLSVALILKQIVMYISVVVGNAFVLPSIVLEVSKVEVTDDELILWNLLYCARLPWSDVKAVLTPRALKFAIIKTPRFFHLINKRDIEHSKELIDTIRMKSGLDSK